MLRMYLLQCWFNLSDEGVADAIYDSYAMRRFMGISFFEQDVADATTSLHFRHLLEEKGIGKLFFDAINRCLEQAGRMMRGGSIVDAESGFVHTVEVTAANVHDVAVAAKLLREDDEVVYGDSAYLGIEKREEVKNSHALSARLRKFVYVCQGGRRSPTRIGLLRPLS